MDTLRKYPPRGPATFRQSDMAKAMKVAKDQGLEIGAIEITKTGTVRVIAKSSLEHAETSNPWDAIPTNAQRTS